MMSNTERTRLQEGIIKAALDGDLEKVKAFISAGAYIDAIVCTRERETLLHRCTHTHIIKELVSRGANHWENAYKETPLVLAIKRGHGIEKIRALLTSRRCYHSPDRDWNTALNNALLRRNTLVVMELLKFNCEIDLKVKSPCSPNDPWDSKCMDSLKLLIKCCIIHAVRNPHKQKYFIEDFRNTPNCRYNELVDYGKECKAEIEKMKNDEIGTNISLFNVVAKYPDDYFKRKSIAVRLTNRSDFKVLYPIYHIVICNVILEPYVKKLHLLKKIDQSDIGLFPWRKIRDVLGNILEYLSNDDLENFISYACESPQCSTSNLTKTANQWDVNDEPSSSIAKRPRLSYPCMGKPALYYATLSPPSRAVMLTAAALGVELELRPINLLKGEHLTPEFIKMNPQHTIPTLDDNGVVITDSHAICAYLVGKYGTDDKLYPKDLVKRANVDARLHLDSGHLFARLRMLYEPILYYGSTDCSIDKIAYIQKCWDILENFLKESPYLCGDELTIGDLCCVATVTSVNEVAPINETKYPKLTAWLERLAELPYYKNVNEEGAEELKKLFKEKLAENKSKK